MAPEPERQNLQPEKKEGEESDRMKEGKDRKEQKNIRRTLPLEPEPDARPKW